MPILRVTPDVRGDTHEKISTGQADSKFGFAMSRAPAAIERIGAVEGLALRRPARAHRLAAARPRAVPPRGRRSSRGSGAFPVCDLGGGLGVRYTEEQPAPPAIEDYVGDDRAGARTRTGLGPGAAADRAGQVARARTPA